jgi:hypothetical protein
MRYFTAIFSGIFMFFAVWFLLGLFFLFLMPASWREIETGFVEGGIPSLLAAILAGMGATYTFKASLHAKTGRLYKKEKTQKDSMDLKGSNQEKDHSKTSDT